MGRVYRVHHRGWDLDLAVKVPLPAVLDDAGGADLFEREAETWVNLGLHPHVVTCHYVRRVEGLPLVFAEYANGGSLHEAIRAGRLDSVEAILDVAIQFAWGLHHAHEQGLVHRDVKPANVMLTTDGLAKVTDFGLARSRAVRLAAPGRAAAGAGHTMTVEGGGGATPAYVSPEQARGETLSRRSDLWSFGLSVLEMFAGRAQLGLRPQGARGARQLPPRRLARRRSAGDAPAGGRAPGALLPREGRRTASRPRRGRGGAAGLVAGERRHALRPPRAPRRPRLGRRAQQSRGFARRPRPRRGGGDALATRPRARSASRRGHVQRDARGLDGGTDRRPRAAAAHGGGLCVASGLCPRAPAAGPPAPGARPARRGHDRFRACDAPSGPWRTWSRISSARGDLVPRRTSP